MPRKTKQPAPPPRKSGGRDMTPEELEAFNNTRYVPCWEVSQGHLKALKSDAT
jgi:hypothetical protein